MKSLLGYALLLLAAAPVAGGSLSVVNGRPDEMADSQSGELLRIVSANAGGARVTLRTQPSLMLTCDSAANPTCLAWVARGRKVRVELRRSDAAPRPGQWRDDCAGTTEPDCAVRMDRGRTVMVDWR